ncbi:MAG: 6-bladed beta-propeller, partial [Planctomycetes bacterium]|nr:6-bladed beta-propeller [Planctomycetota bacterium]
MKNCLISISITIVLIVAMPVFAAEKTEPVRMGGGLMTFDTVPGWGLGSNGMSVIGPTHGAVVIDKAGNIYTSANIGVFVFSPDGKVIRRFLGDEYTNIHDMEIRRDAEGEFIYAARNKNAEG